MNTVTDLGILTGAHHLEEQLRQGTLTTPLRLADGSTMFVWQGSADRVELVTWMPSFPTVPPFTRLGGSDVWVLVLRLPGTAMIEYRLGIDRRGRQQLLIDPLNPVVTTNPFGTNSVASGHDYHTPVWAEPDDDVPAGSLTEIRVQSTAWAERRHHSLYLPSPEFETSTDHVLVVHDGTDFLEHSRLAIVLDNLIAGGSISPTAAILHQPRRRLSEYAADERHTAHVLDELVPYVHRRINRPSPDSPLAVSVLGSSLGAVAALSVAWARPERIRGVGLLSGSFARTLSPDRPDSIFGPITRFVEHLDEDRLVGRPIYVSCGRYEGLIDLNRSLVPRLRAGGADVRYEETWDGHQWSSWRDRLAGALVHMSG